jgi:type I restriction enzyme R subunit
VATDTAYQNALKNTPQTARIEHDRALASAMLVLLKDDTEAYKQYVQNPAFKRFVADMVFGLTSGRASSIRKRPSSPTPQSRYQVLKERLAQSSDPRDRLGVSLLEHVERRGRVTLGDALRTAAAEGLSDDDALAAVERLARPRAAALERFYVDRSGSEARIASPDEVRERATEASNTWGDWASSVEVVWAANEHEALAGGLA